MLDNVETYKYDKYWNNNVDPKVLKTLTSNERKMRKVLRKSYGFRYTKMIPGYYARSNNVSSLNLTACIKKCIQKEKSKFAQRCRQDGGIFKCCLSYYPLGPYEEARNMLIRENLINDTQTHFCNDKSMKDPCLYCSENGFCTTFNPATGKTIQLHYPGTKPSHKSNS